MANALMKEQMVMKKKIVSISSERQITIPQKIYYELGFSDEAECIVRKGSLIIRPARRNLIDDFDFYIVKDLKKEGVPRRNVSAMLRYRAKVRVAAKIMLKKAKNVAYGLDDEYSTYDDIFDEED